MSNFLPPAVSCLADGGPYSAKIFATGFDASKSGLNHLKMLETSALFCSGRNLFRSSRASHRV